MTAVNLTTLLKKANKNNYAVAGLVVLGWEDALAYTQAADETGIPIILQAGPSCREHTPVPILGKMFRYLADQTKTHICCHIDHGYSLKECKEGMDNGFTSVMFDGSKLPLSKNINASLSIVKLAKSYKVSVEGEVGIVGYHNGKISEGTKVNEAKRFVDESEVDAIAISVGNTHLQTNKIAKIDIKKIIDLQNVINIPLVLHGSSGIGNAMRRKIAKTTNVAKFNIGTELRLIFGNSLRANILQDKDVFDRLKILKPTIKEIKKVAMKVILNIGPVNE
ncbi:MAG: 6-phospho-5-dehydro-2-deoxy-D-gluconate aldolase [Alphaproteobacteria bacterium MarineAlpha5_Bin2]|jgi:fructose-bisphosphate aldolase class II|nr:class II fructose-bisphosphate aldolase [Alphaproteobacteria bacterium]PPR53024.1 MAG: 6-phospho-5-dehydro-2-deoxy-D-gluconate aldolase [Alphaproteobacteria bacterium MarineAlpha5_Bin2]